MGRLGDPLGQVGRDQLGQAFTRPLCRDAKPADRLNGQAGLSRQRGRLVDQIDRVIVSKGDEAVIDAVRAEVNEKMSTYPLFAHQNS